MTHDASWPPGGRVAFPDNAAWPGAPATL